MGVNFRRPCTDSDVSTIPWIDNCLYIFTYSFIYYDFSQVMAAQVALRRQQAQEESMRLHLGLSLGFYPSQQNSIDGDSAGSPTPMKDVTSPSSSPSNREFNFCQRFSLETIWKIVIISIYWPFFTLALILGEWGMRVCVPP